MPSRLLRPPPQKIHTDRGEWLPTDLARSLADEVTDIREEMAALQGRFARVMAT